jgi:hypothetical protein
MVSLSSKRIVNNLSRSLGYVAKDLYCWTARLLASYTVSQFRLFSGIHACKRRDPSVTYRLAARCLQWRRYCPISCHRGLDPAPMALGTQLILFQSSSRLSGTMRISTPGRHLRSKCAAGDLYKPVVREKVVWTCSGCSGTVNTSRKPCKSSGGSEVKSFAILFESLLKYNWPQALKPVA